MKKKEINYCIVLVSVKQKKNKYAIYAYTHGPVTGSGGLSQQCSVNDKAKGPSSLPPPLFSQCEAHGPPIGVGREKNISTCQL